MNYQKEMEQIISQLNGEKKRLLLHSCCAPCSSYCLEVLREYFYVTVFYYNPNISWEEEYRKRVEEQKRLIASYNEQVEKSDFTNMNSSSAAARIEVIEGDYDVDDFFRMANGLEGCPEGGERCFRCFDLRLRKTAQLAKEKNFDFFATTLTISPLKNAAKLNEIGLQLQEENGVRFLPSDFKKKDGYKRSIVLSEQFGLYRQDYCGCAYSKAESERKRGHAELQKTEMKNDRDFQLV